MLPTYLFRRDLVHHHRGRLAAHGSQPAAIRSPLTAAPVRLQLPRGHLLVAPESVRQSAQRSLRGGREQRVRAFSRAGVKNAQRTLTVIIFILAVLLAGISYLVKGFTASSPPIPVSPGTKHSFHVDRRDFRRACFYYLTIGSIL